jgi:uncharacterized protein YndB with AHSA1/START domain
VGKGAPAEDHALTGASQHSLGEKVAMSDRASASWSVMTTAPPELTFAYLTDIRRHHEWSSRPHRIDPLTAGPVGVGTRFASYGSIPGDRNHREEVEVIEHQPPHLFTTASGEPGRQVVDRFVVTAQGSGSRIERTMDMPRPGGLAGLAFPLVVRTVIRPTVGRDMAALSALADTLPDTLDGGTTGTGGTSDGPASTGVG